MISQVFVAYFLMCITVLNLCHHFTFRLGSSMMYDGTTILLRLAMVSILGKHISALCTPFAYNRESDCSNALANSTSQACSEMNLTTDRGFCELRSLADIEYLESVARILGTTKLSVNSFIIFMYITIMRPCTHHNIYVYVRACVCVCLPNRKCSQRRN